MSVIADVINLEKLTSQWESVGPLQICAVTTAPTKGTVTVEETWVRRLGQNLEISWNYEQTVAGTIGAGDYAVVMPGGLTIDTNITGEVLSGSNAGRSIVGTMSFAATAGDGYGYVNVRDGRHLGAFMVNPSADDVWGASGFGFAFSAAKMGFNITVPIVGW